MKTRLAVSVSAGQRPDRPYRNDVINTLPVVVLGRVWQRPPNETPANGPPARLHRSATTNAVRHLPLKIPRHQALKVTG
jgi:hypothetical protein